jgi:hypothetical protein
MLFYYYKFQNIVYTPFDYANVLVLNLQKWLLYEYYELNLMGKWKLLEDFLN